MITPRPLLIILVSLRAFRFVPAGYLPFLANSLRDYAKPSVSAIMVEPLIRNQLSRSRRR